MIEAKRAHYLCTEHYHYADIVECLGSDSVHMLGKYYPEYIQTDFDPYTRYPSLHNTPIIKHIFGSIEDINIEQYDAIIIGIRSGELGEKLRKRALKKNIMVVIIDYFDHLDVYANPTLECVTRGLVWKKDFDLYFKHDLPLMVNEEYLLPIAPMPIRNKAYPKINVQWKNKNTPIFYSGRSGHRPRADRIQLCEEIGRRINGSKIVEIGPYEKISIVDYANNLANTKIALSPSGKVWDSTRHSETGLYLNVPLIPKPDCQTVNNLIKNDINALQYEIEINKVSGIYQVKCIDDLIEKINYYLEHDQDLMGMAAKWRQEILESHTTLARAQYMLRNIEMWI